MTAPTKTERRKQIRLLQELRLRLKHDGDMAVHGIGRQEIGYKMQDQAFAIGVALEYMAQHVNLETGELTVSLEPDARQRKRGVMG